MCGRVNPELKQGSSSTLFYILLNANNDTRVSYIFPVIFWLTDENKTIKFKYNEIWNNCTYFFGVMPCGLYHVGTKNFKKVGGKKQR
jgi:hypothetical protein